ncbi:tRNA (adenosine(37)-N6)-threonylcarbamoyltransferase complex ATPase subunit type 1 TsaE [Tropicimonas sp.]|uniref:tRNA (adenosine(37)-N6)-threonylcarbamoyltransferase complex ATPase subunit type 1 TsaE n=1 Tax=Tropicimonas sp. TaxID=2067044 RepID=UPI003A8A1084
MTIDNAHQGSARIALAGPGATDRLGQVLGRLLRRGDTVLLSGPIGAGKSHLARAIIRTRLAESGAPPEDIPSPTYTLVQTYSCGDTEIWHADLYRLSGPDEIQELGLDMAFAHAICLVEWPDRLGELTPRNALTVTLSLVGDGRIAELGWCAPRWEPTVAQLSAIMEYEP